MRVSLFVTCLVDQLWSSVGTSTVEVLRRAGCTVEFDDRQTCCGQPAFNTGYRQEARKLAQRFIEISEDSMAEAIVSSLLPPVHIAVIAASSICRTLGEALLGLRRNGGSESGLSRTVTLITGPSRTADIELTLAIGVHGPQELFVILDTAS
jgi:hypothetical protein